MINNITFNGDNALWEYLSKLDAWLLETTGEQLNNYSCVADHRQCIASNENLMFVWAPDMKPETLCNLIVHETTHLVLHKIGEHEASSKLNDITDMDRLVLIFE